MWQKGRIPLRLFGVWARCCLSVSVCQMNELQAPVSLLSPARTGRYYCQSAQAPFAFWKSLHWSILSEASRVFLQLSSVLTCSTALWEVKSSVIFCPTQGKDQTWSEGMKGIWRSIITSLKFTWHRYFVLIILHKKMGLCYSIVCFNLLEWRRFKTKTQSNWPLSNIFKTTGTNWTFAKKLQWNKANNLKM